MRAECTINVSLWLCRCSRSTSTSSCSCSLPSIHRRISTYKRRQREGSWPTDTVARVSMVESLISLSCTGAPRTLPPPLQRTTGTCSQTSSTLTSHYSIKRRTSSSNKLPRLATTIFRKPSRQQRNHSPCPPKRPPWPPKGGTCRHQSWPVTCSCCHLPSSSSSPSPSPAQGITISPNNKQCKSIAAVRLRTLVVSW